MDRLERLIALARETERLAHLVEREVHGRHPLHVRQEVVDPHGANMTANDLLDGAPRDAEAGRERLPRRAGGRERAEFSYLVVVDLPHRPATFTDGITDVVPLRAE